jgi:hypothetical protein
MEQILYITGTRKGEGVKTSTQFHSVPDREGSSRFNALILTQTALVSGAVIGALNALSRGENRRRPLTRAVWVRMRALNLDASDQYQNSWQGRRPSIRITGLNPSRSGTLWNCVLVLTPSPFRVPVMYRICSIAQRELPETAIRSLPLVMMEGPDVVDFSGLVTSRHAKSGDCVLVLTPSPFRVPVMYRICSIAFSSWRVSCL